MKTVMKIRRNICSEEFCSGGKEEFPPRINPFPNVWLRIWSLVVFFQYLEMHQDSDSAPHIIWGTIIKSKGEFFATNGPL